MLTPKRFDADEDLHEYHFDGNKAMLRACGCRSHQDCLRMAMLLSGKADGVLGELVYTSLPWLK